jgi:uncharacterized protein YegP (UPF0339 family)
LEAAHRYLLKEDWRMMGSVERREEELAEIDLTEDEIDAMMAAGETVDVVGPAGRAQTVRFELFSDARRRYGWRLVSSTGEVLATGGQFFGTKNEALRAVDAIMRSAAHAALIDKTGRAS